MRLATSFWVFILAPFLSFSQTDYQLDHFQNGKHYHQQGDMSNAIQFYTEAIRENNAHAKALYNRGIAYYQTNNFEAAEADFQILMVLQPDDMECRQNLATIEFMRGNFLDALSHYDLIIQKRPTGEIYGQRAMVKTYLQSYPEALSDLQVAMQYEPNEASYYVQEGDVYTAMEQFDQAIHAYSQAIEMNVENADAFNNRANAKVSLGAYQEAVYDYNNAILVSQESHFFSNRANCHIYLGKPEATIADANEALRLDPDNDEAYYFKGLALLNLQYYKEALMAFDQAIYVNDQDGEYYGQRGVAQYMMQRFQAAVQDFEQAVTIDPDLSESYRLLEMAQAEVNYRPHLTQVEQQPAMEYDQSIPVQRQPVDATIRSRSIYPYVPSEPKEERFETGKRMF